MADDWECLRAEKTDDATGFRAWVEKKGPGLWQWSIWKLDNVKPRTRGSERTEGEARAMAESEMSAAILAEKLKEARGAARSAS